MGNIDSFQLSRNISKNRLMLHHRKHDYTTEKMIKHVSFKTANHIINEVNLDQLFVDFRQNL